jgi:putative transposase
MPLRSYLAVAPEPVRRHHGAQSGADRKTGAVPDPSAARAPDLVRRQFKAARPGQLHVADFTYVQMVTGRFTYTAFVIDAFAGLIPGWECSLSEQAAFVEAAIRQAPPTGPGTGTRSARTRSTTPTPAARAVHSVHVTETLLLAGLAPSIGTTAPGSAASSQSATVASRDAGGKVKAQWARAGSGVPIWYGSTGLAGPDPTSTAHRPAPSAAHRYPI